MRLRLIESTPDVEAIIVAAMLTTTSGAKPSKLYERLRSNASKVETIISRLETQHGSILEHNRLIWRVEATVEEVLEIMLRTRFFNITRLDGTDWLMSGNLRTVLEYHEKWDDELSEKIIESLIEVIPNMYRKLRSRRI